MTMFSHEDMILDTELRAKLADGVISCLEEAVPGSMALLRGSLGRNRADLYSDIDVFWEVPDTLFKPCVDSLKEIVSKVRPLESIRFAPEFQISEKRRLVFIQFECIPLFWRLDLAIFAQSIKGDREYDRHNPRARSSEWSLTESALMNTVEAVKAHLRNKDGKARRLLLKAYQQVGLNFPDLELISGRVTLPLLILKLADEIKAINPERDALAERIKKITLKE